MGFSSWAPYIAGPVIGAAFDMYGSHKDRDAAAEANAANAQLQREFAMNGIQWRVADARAAGIHPLAALGASGANASPSFVVGDAGGNYRALGNMSREMGQNLTRAAYASADPLEKEFKAEQLRSVRTQNNILDVQLAKEMQDLHNGGQPSIPLNDGGWMPGQGNSRGLVQEYPRRRPMSDSLKPSQVAGWTQDVDWVRTPNGLSPVIPQDLSEAYESDEAGSILWQLRNRFLPNLGDTTNSPSSEKLPVGANRWIWNYYKQAWVPDYGVSNQQIRYMRRNMRIRR